MQRITTYLTGFLLFFGAIEAMAGEVNDTLLMNDGTQVILTYTTGTNNSECTVYFTGTRIVDRGKYKDKSKVKVVFFDRTGSFDTDFSTKPTAMTPVGNASFSRSSSGYYFISDTETPILNVFGSGSLSIPIYLALYKKKGKWEILTKSNANLSISVSPSSAKASSLPNSNNQRKQQLNAKPDSMWVQVPGEEEYEDFVPGTFPSIPQPQYDDNGGGGKSPEDYKNQVDNLMNEISSANDATDLEDIKGQLRQIQMASSDPEVQQKVNDALSSCAAKKKEIKDAEVAQQEQKQKDMEAAAKEEAEKSQSRNFWLILGGIGLAVLGFLGNQVMQHIRSVRSMKDITNMQNSIVNNAKRQTGNMLRSQAGQVVNPNVVRGVENVGRQAHSVKKNSGTSISTSATTTQTAASPMGKTATKKVHTPVTKENMEAYARQQFEKQNRKSHKKNKDLTI